MDNIEIERNIIRLRGDLEALKKWLVCSQNKHMYLAETCPHCGAEFCLNCCRRTNITKDTPPLNTYEKKRGYYLICPVCGYDYYEDIHRS